MLKSAMEHDECVIGKSLEVFTVTALVQDDSGLVHSGAVDDDTAHELNGSVQGESSLTEVEDESVVIGGAITEWTQILC